MSTKVQVEAKRQIEAAKRKAFASRERLSIGSLEAAQNRVPPYGKFECRAEVHGTWDNPFDDEQVRVNAEILCPDGDKMTLECFFMQPYEPLNDEGDVVRACGGPVWCARFTPSKPGKYRIRFVVENKGECATTDWGTFVCEGTPVNGGYVRRDSRSAHYFRLDDGRPFFAIGENICWSWRSSIADHRKWIARLGQAGANYGRIWMTCRHGLGIEWTPNDSRAVGTFYGLGRYSQDNAWRIDRILEAAEKAGIRLMLCLGWHGELNAAPDYFGCDDWKRSPYNAKNGGPCKSPRDFWTNAEAKRFYKRRLRYIVARWGYSTSIHSWELWNEVRAPADWVQEMAGYLKQIDPNHHLVSTTYGDDDVWRLKEVDFTQVHLYGNDRDKQDCSRQIAAACESYRESYQKPFLVSEFGINWKRCDIDLDPNGLGTNFHNGMWSAMASGAAGTAMIWYWDQYVDKLDLYREFRAIARFVADVPWTRQRFSALVHTEPRWTSSAGPGRPASDLQIRPKLGWARATTQLVSVHSDGEVTMSGDLSGFLFGPIKSNMSTPVVFDVDFPKDGFFRMHIGKVSDFAGLTILLDGKPKVVERFPDRTQFKFRAKEYVKKYDLWQYVYDCDIEVPVPHGRHSIRVALSEGDWLSVDSYTFVGIPAKTGPPVDIYGLATETMAIVWMRNKQSSWFHDASGEEPDRVAETSFSIVNLQDGRYVIEWWDTRKATIFATSQAQAENGVLPVRIPSFTRDIAAKIRLKE